MDPAGHTISEPIPVHLSAIRRHFEISLYFTLLTGVLTLVSTGKLDLVTILVMPSAMLYKGYRWWHSKGPEITNRTATWLTVAYFVFFPFDLWIVSRMLAAGAQNPALYAALLATIHLMLFATVVRLYSASTTRDYLFLTMMGFTCMLAAAILTVDTVFLRFSSSSWGWRYRPLWRWRCGAALRERSRIRWKPEPERQIICTTP
jgi:hypothetical protein